MGKLLHLGMVGFIQAMVLMFIAAPAIIRTIYRLKEPKEKDELLATTSLGGK